MSIDQIHSFVTVAEEGAMVRAARRLHITQPPLSRKIAALEDELGVRLFERQPRGVTLTSNGRRFLPYARSVLSAVSEAKEAFL